jgi:hypothetical protein
VRATSHPFSSIPEEKERRESKTPPLMNKHGAEKNVDPADRRTIP